MNSDNGGTLLLGVRDDGTIRGINREYRLIDRSKRNRMAISSSLVTCFCPSSRPIIHFSSMKSNITSYPAERFTPSGSFPAEYPVYLDKRLYVRSGNQTLEMRGPDLVSYVKKRWPGKE